MHFAKKLIYAASLMACCSSVHAVAIHLAYTAAIPTQADNNGAGSLATWASQSIATYNLTNTDLPALPASGFTVTQGGSGPPGFTFGDNVESITLGVPANTYLILSFGGSNLNVGNGNAENLYFIDTTGFYTFLNEPNASGGLSSIHFYGNPSAVPIPGGPVPPSVPDGGSTLALLGGALVGLAALRRLLKS